MKKILYWGFALALALVTTSCKDWLDVNTDPDNPTNDKATCDERLMPIQHHLEYAYETCGVRAAYIMQTLTRDYASGNSFSELSGWNPPDGMSTTPYQHFFVGCAANIRELIDKATAEEAWHYVGAAKFIYAWGFMTMLDWYGEMPMSEALGSALNPVYDDGEKMFTQSVEAMKEAITYFEMEQPATATKLVAGDMWMGGDPQRWIKAANGFLARWMNNLSKKSSLYKPDDILAYLAKAPQSVAESFVSEHMNTADDPSRDPLAIDPVKTSVIYDNTGMNSYPRMAKWYTDLLENMRGAGVEDPRADKIIPLGEFNIGGELVLLRSKGADLQSDIRLTSKGSGPAQANIVKQADGSYQWDVVTEFPERKADSMILRVRARGFYTYKDLTDDTWIVGDRIETTASFYTRPDAPSHFMTYAECCFIKAEVLFRKGDKAGALAAYKAGIRAHMELLNLHLNKRSDQTTIVGERKVLNRSKTPITGEQIESYLASAAVVQSAGDLRMSDIMLQKYVACSFSQQNWNDMRRFNYSAGNIDNFGVVYTGFERPYEFTTGNSSSIAQQALTDQQNKTNEDGYWWRRVKHCGHERNYNSVNLHASNERAYDKTIWAMPVWWDKAE